MPSRQRGQRPHPACTSTVTRSPIWNSSTVGPSFTTVPIYSWPGVKPLLNGSPPSIIAGTPWRMISMSVAHTAIASIRTSTSANPGCGTGFSTSESSSGPPSTQALIRSGIGYWLLRGGVSARAEPMVFRPVLSAAADCQEAAGRRQRWKRRAERNPGSLLEPDIGEVLADVLARRDVPAFEFRRGDDQAVPPQERHRGSLAHRMPLEIADD